MSRSKSTRYTSLGRKGASYKPSKKGARYSTTSRSLRSKRKPSEDLVGAADEILETIRPELNEVQRHRVATIMAREVRPAAKMVRSRDIRRGRTAIARTLGTEARLYERHPRFTS